MEMGESGVDSPEGLQSSSDIRLLGVQGDAAAAQPAIATIEVKVVRMYNNRTKLAFGFDKEGMTTVHLDGANTLVAENESPTIFRGEVSEHPEDAWLFAFPVAVVRYLDSRYPLPWNRVFLSDQHPYAQDEDVVPVVPDDPPQDSKEIMKERVRELRLLRDQGDEQAREELFRNWVE